MNPSCEICLGEGWVCENHPQNPWNFGDPSCCGGAGAPCDCNTQRPPRAKGKEYIVRPKKKCILRKRETI